MTPEEVALLSELTIIIPTYNRPLELERAIEYWRDTPVTVHILDGSEKPWFQEGDILGTSKIIYHHLPSADGEDSRGNYFRRIRGAGNLILTDYAVLCGDDDFFTVSGLSEIVSRLDSDMDVDAIVGRCAIYRNSSGVSWSTKYLNITNSYKFRSKSVAVRLRNQTNAPWIYYGVIRSELWRKLFALSFENKFNYPMTAFSVSRILDKALCKIVVLDRLVWIRREQVINPASTDKEVNQILELLSGNRILTRLRISHLALTAAMYSSKSKISVLTLFRAWKLTSHKTFRKRTNKIKFYKVAYQNYLKLKLFLRHFRWRAVPNSSVFNVAGVINGQRKKDLGLESFFIHLNSLRICFDSKELIEFEKLITMPREKLRLRANI